MRHDSWHDALPPKEGHHGEPQTERSLAHRLVGELNLRENGLGRNELKNLLERDVERDMHYT